jgi:RNA polymerase sigma-54 factor
MKLTQTTSTQQRILPTQIQYLNFLKLQQHELQQNLREEIEENLFLEEDIKTDEDAEGDELTQEISYEDADSYEEEYSFREVGVNDSKIHQEKRDVLSNAEGYVNTREELVEELRTMHLKEEEFNIGSYIIHCLDSDGYLRSTCDDIADSLSFKWQKMIDEKQVEEVLETVQNCGPAGVAARDLRECLMLQIFRKEKKTRVDVHAYNILDDNFNLLAERKFSAIREEQGLSSEQFEAAMRQIKKLNASPCNLDNSSSPIQKKVDTGIDFVIMEDENGILKGELADSFISNVRINNAAVEMLKSLAKKKKKTKTEASKETFLKSKAQSAKWFLDCISQREQSMKLVINCIVELQEKFLRSNNQQDLVPMVLQDIADRTDLDVSTISRITSTRYADTNHGKIALKDLFTFGIQATNGNYISNINVKEMLGIIIENEDKNNPYTDYQISKILEDKGIKIARRTVLKYRDELNVPSAKFRVLKAA